MAPVRLADPSRDRSAEDRICTFPGILSISMAIPGIAVDSTTMDCSCSLPPDADIVPGSTEAAVVTASAALAGMESANAIAQHGRLTAR